jgi:2-keto-4-pentenoate hydratase
MDLEAVVDSIWRSARQGVYYPREWRGMLSTHQAYQVQLGILGRHLERGEVQAGWKVGLTAKAMQVQQGVHEPVFGFLLASWARPSGTVFRFADLIQPGFENELCLTIGAPLRGPGVTMAQARAAMAGVAPALEIIERRGDFAADLNLALADNAQQKAFVTGRVTSPLPSNVRLSEASVEVVVNGQLMERASGAAVMGDPVASVVWLANKLAEFNRSVEAGMRIMSGSLTRQYPVDRGNRVEARFEPFGTVRATFE